MGGTGWMGRGVFMTLGKESQDLRGRLLRYAWAGSYQLPWGKAHLGLGAAPPASRRVAGRGGRWFGKLGLGLGMATFRENVGGGGGVLYAEQLPYQTSQRREKGGRGLFFAPAAAAGGVSEKQTPQHLPTNPQSLWERCPRWLVRRPRTAINIIIGVAKYSPVLTSLPVCWHTLT